MAQSTSSGRTPWRRSRANCCPHDDTVRRFAAKAKPHAKNRLYRQQKPRSKDGKPAGILFGSVGFEIRNKEGKAVAAVSKIDKGVVYMQGSDEEERFLLANVCAALLMQEVIA